MGNKEFKKVLQKLIEEREEHFKNLSKEEVEKEVKRLTKLAKYYTSPNNVSYSKFRNLVQDFGFVYERTKGSHETFILFVKTKHFVKRVLMEIQPDKNKAKSYQINQLFQKVETYLL